MPNPVYDIAIASDCELPPIGGSILEQPLDDSEIVKSWSAAVSDRDRQIVSLNQSIAQRDEQIVAAQESHLRQEASYRKDVEQLKSALANREAELKRIQDQLVMRLNAVQCSAASQLARPFAWAEQRWPRIVTACAMLPKVVWWTATLNVSRFSLARTVQKIKRSGLFEERWYVQHNPDVVAAGGNPLLHWLLNGWKERRDPHPLFNVSWYLEQNPDVLAADVNPLLHYLDSGAIEGCDPNPLFDSSWYLDQYPDVAGKGVNPLVHYLQSGAAEGRDPNPLFETARYLEQNPVVATSGLNPLVHYIRTGTDDGHLVASGAVHGLDVTDVDHEIRKTPRALVGEEGYVTSSPIFHNRRSKNTPPIIFTR